MRRLGVVFAVMVMTVASSCGGGTSTGSGPQTRTVFVDHDDDRFVGSFLSYFPASVTVHPGDTVDFRQEWTGEPHSVTFGTLVDKMLPLYQALKAKYAPEDPPDQEEAPFTEAVKPLPLFLDGENDSIIQGAAQPCYLDSGGPPVDPATPCPRGQQPAFNGRQSYYNSGVIPYDDDRGNRFRVRLADDIAPGTYRYYCNWHGPDMAGQIVVAADDAPIPSQSEVTKRTQNEIEAVAAPLATQINRAEAGRDPGLRGKNLSGLLPTVYATGSGNEFVPRTIEARVGRKVTWLFQGGHTVSFEVPHYFPILTIAKDGTVAVSTKATKPAGPFEEPPPDAPKPFVADGGTWAGSGFRSSGLVYGDRDKDESGYSLTFSRPGTYKYACLIHPRMVGTITVK